MASNVRIGLGEDSHRTAAGGPLRLGGVDVPHDRHLVDDINRNRDSAEFLRLANDRVKQAGYQIVNLDCVIAAQRPKLSPHKETIIGRIAEILGVAPTQINLKAKTGEGVGPVGQEEVIEARCVALLATDN
jgi:2-C-methyl-D-erythritol 2,4-cyclodiphosphate synthase